jgi:hypothetical protein
MKCRHIGWYAAAVAAVVVGALALGAPAFTVFVGLALLACPLMMMFMMGGHGGGSDPGSHDAPQRSDPAERS